LNRRLPACENILSREFQAGRGGEKWVSDITYPRTRGGWVYQTAGKRLYDRKVIGWAFSADMKAVHTAIPAREMAFANRKDREGLLFYSDRGAQYCAKAAIQPPFRRYAYMNYTLVGTENFGCHCFSVFGYIGTMAMGA
jgi:transposase InsO family protein